jgi:hypothetical protein
VTDDTISLTGDSTVGQLVYDIYIDGRQTLYFDCFEGRYNTRLNAPANKSCMITVNGKVVVNQYPLQKLNGILDLGTFENESIRVDIVNSQSGFITNSYASDDMASGLASDARNWAVDTFDNIVNTVVDTMESAT